MSIAHVLRAGNSLRALAAVLLLAALPQATAADLYRWQDENGKVQYGGQIPPPSARNVTKLKPANAGLVPQRTATQPYSSTVAAARYPLVLFSPPDCGAPCNAAEEFLNKRGVPYTLKNREQDKAELKQLTSKPEAPVLLVGKEIISGFEAEEWGKLLDAAGYARDNPYAGLGGSTVTMPQADSAPAADMPAGE